MSECYHIFGQDLVLGATGDLLLVSGPVQTQQRVMRRLFTNQGAYLWHLAYGAGLPARVGRKANAAVIAGVIRSQIFMESSIAASPAPTVTLSVTVGGVVVANIVYTDTSTDQPVSIQIPITGQ